jgi:ribosomal-protein-alanine N-acetyltransferase
MRPAAGWRVLPVGAEAAAVLAALHARCFDEAWGLAATASLLAAGQGFVAEPEAGDGPPVGFALARAVADEAELLSLGVVPEARRREVGHALLQALTAWAAGAGLCRIHLEVAEDNRAARLLYRQHGFETVGRRAGYYAGRDALLLRRELAP